MLKKRMPPTVGKLQGAQSQIFQVGFISNLSKFGKIDIHAKHMFLIGHWMGVKA